MNMMRARWLTLALGICATGLTGQAETTTHGFSVHANGLRSRCVEVPGARGVCVLMAVGVGRDHDPAGSTGMAEAIGAWLRLRQGDHVVDEHLQISVTGRATVIAGTTDGVEIGDLLGRLREILAGELPCDDDAFQRAAGQAALAADDERHVFPGPALTWATRRALLAGTPAGRQSVGLVGDLEQLGREPGRLAVRYRELFRPRHAVVTVVGAIDGGAAEQVASILGALPGGDHEAPELAVHDALPAVERECVHNRVAGPFVTMALRAPRFDDPDRVVFTVAMEVLGSLAARAFRDARGQEQWARFVPYRFDETADHALVLLGRRGRDGETVEPAKTEMTGFADEVRAHGARPEQIERAIDVVSRRFALPPYEWSRTRVFSARSLYPRARTLALAELAGWPADFPERLRAVTAEAVEHALASALAAENREWFALLPPPQ